MSASAAKSGRGTVLNRGNAATPEVFSPIGEMVNIAGPGYTLDHIEVTNHDSPSGATEYIGGKLSAGEIDIEGNYVPGTTPQQTGLLADMVARTLRNFTLIRPTATTETVSFSALVIAINYEHPYNKQMGFKAKLKINGLPVIS